MQGSLVKVIRETPGALKAMLTAQSRRFTLPLVPTATVAQQRGAAVSPRFE
jgi:hypothetical protein